MIESFRPFVNFLMHLEKNGLLHDRIEGSHVIYADDQYVNQSTMKKNF